MVSARGIAKFLLRPIWRSRRLGLLAERYFWSTWCGVVLLSHAMDEAATQGYTGLHQWNLTERDGDFVLWNPSDTINVTQALAATCNVKTRCVDDHVVVEITKRR